MTLWATMDLAHSSLALAAWSCVSNSLALRCQSWALAVASANLVSRSAILLSLASPSAWATFSSSLREALAPLKEVRESPDELPDVSGDVQPGFPQARHNTADNVSGAGHIEVPQGLACATAGNCFNPPHPPKPLKPPGANSNSSSSRPGRLGGLPGGGGCRGGPWLSGLIMSPLQPPPPSCFPALEANSAWRARECSTGRGPPPKLWSTIMQSEMLHFSPVVLKKTSTFPELLLHTAAPQMASTTPPPPLRHLPIP